MFLVSALAASPAGLYLTAEERQTIAREASLRSHPKQYAAQRAASECMERMRCAETGTVGNARERLMRMWNDGTLRAIDFPLLDEDLPSDETSSEISDRVKHPKHYFRVHGKQFTKCRANAKEPRPAKAENDA